MSYLSPYRGSRYGRKKRFKIVLLVLVLLVVLLVAAFILLQNHIVFADDGTVRFDFGPGAAAGDDHAPGADDGTDVPLVIGGDGTQTPGVPGTTTPDAPAEPTTPAGPTEPADPQPPAEPDAPYTARLLTPADVLAGVTLPAEYDAVAVTVKGADGLCWVADPMAATEGTAADAQAFQTALAALDCRKLAVVSALRDPIRPRNVDRSCAMKVESGSIWLDWDYCSWFDPYAAGTSDYLAALVKSCADAGFDGVLLTDFQFPTRGKTALIDFGTQTQSRTEALTALAERLADAELPVSCLLTGTAAQTGSDEPAGQEAAALAAALGQVWATAAAPEDAAALRGLVGQDAAALWLTQADAGDAVCDRIMP